MNSSFRYLFTGLALAGSLHAQVLMLDFGATEVASPSLDNSPYHTADGAFAGTSWNQVTNVDPGALLWADGTEAEGISVNIGGNDGAGVTTVNLAKTGITSSALGNFTNTEAYADTSVGKDGIFLGSSGLRATGFQVGGLAAGTYEVYLTARNTNLAGAHVQNLYVSTATTTANFDFSAYTTAQLSYTGSDDAISAWVVGDNYVKFTVSLGLNEYLNVASYGGTGEGRGFLNSAQIVATIPEPSSAGLIAGVGMLGLATLRRRRRLA